MKKLPKNLRFLREVKEPPINWEKERIVSYSQYSTWKQCPHRWKLQNVDKHKSPPSIDLVFGNAMHKTIQEYMKIMYEKSGAEADRYNWSHILEGYMRSEYVSSFEKNGKKHFSTPEEMDDYFHDGKLTMEFFQKNRSSYFSVRNNHLIGIEFPLSFAPHEDYPGIIFKGYIDLLMYNENTQKLYITDFKTSKSTWKDYDKKDETKISQVVLYKENFSKIFNWDIDKIDVEYFILKRKIWEESEFPIPRIQRFEPASGKIKRAAVTKSFREFVEDCFTKDNKFQEKEYTKNVGDSCRWCPFKNNFILCNKNSVSS